MAGHNRGARADRRDDGPRTSGFGIGSPVSIELEPIRTPKPSTNGHKRFYADVANVRATGVLEKVGGRLVAEVPNTALGRLDSP